jgi:hypothetical protein
MMRSCISGSPAVGKPEGLPRAKPSEIAILVIVAIVEADIVIAALPKRWNWQRPSAQ